MVAGWVVAAAAVGVSQSKIVQQRAMRGREPWAMRGREPWPRWPPPPAEAHREMRRAMKAEAAASADRGQGGVGVGGVRAGCVGAACSVQARDEARRCAVLHGPPTPACSRYG